MADLAKEFNYYKTNQTSLVQKFDGKVLVIQSEHVVGAYDSLQDAANAAVSSGLAPGTFLIQKCSAGDKDYTQTFHTRVRFA